MVSVTVLLKPYVFRSNIRQLSHEKLGYLLCYDNIGEVLLMHYLPRLEQKMGHWLL